MSWHAHPDATALVREHWHEAEAFLVAQRPPCIEIRDDEVRHIDRLLIGGRPDDLRAWKRPASWFIAVLVCDGDDTEALTAFVRDEGMDARRVHFYLHEAASGSALAAWRDAGLPLDRVDDRVDGRPIRDWKDLHRLLGLHLNVQIVADFT